MKQIEMQSQLHAQLMEQRKLQQRIEAHGKYLESIRSGSNGSSTSNTKTRCMGTTKTACPGVAELKRASIHSLIIGSHSGLTRVVNLRSDT